MNHLEPQTPWQNVNLPTQSTPPVGRWPIREIEESASLLDYWRVIKKHKWKVVACVAVALTVALIYVLSATPKYTSWATLLIEPKGPRVVKFEEMLTEPIQSGENEYYQSQFEMLKSRSLAADVIKSHGLDKHRVFTNDDRDPNFAQRLRAVINGWWRAAISVIVAQHRGDSGERNPYGVASGHIDTYQEMLQVDPVKRSRLVKIGFSAPDPMLAADMANAHAEAYMRQERKLRSQANQDARQFLESKLAELKSRVESSEAVLNQFRKGKGIISLDDKENIVVERLADLNRRLTEAEVERIGLESQARLIKRRDYDSLPAVINNSLIQSLKGQLVNLEGQHANLAAQFKSGYPPVAKLKAQIEETRQRLKQQVRAVVEGINSAYFAAAAKESALAAEMKKQKAMALALKDDAVSYAILEREADTNRKLYDGVLERMREIGVTAELPSSNRSILDIAEVPRWPSHPRKKMALLFAGVVGMMGGLGLVLVFEYLDNTLRTPEEVEQYLGLPNLAVVPDFFCLSKIRASSYSANRGRVPSRDGELYLPGKKFAPLNLPPSAVTEAYRKLRTSVLLSRPGSPPQTVLFTSGTDGEGKTITAANSAIMFAQMGYKVLVIDADFYRPSCHRALRTRNVVGLTDFLAGQTSLESAIMPTAIPELHLLSRGSAAPNPTELVGSQKMLDTLAALKRRFDFLLIDSPPVTPVSDAVLLSAMVDGVIFVVQGQKTRKQLVRAAVAQLRNSQGKILGVVLNRVDIGSADYSDLYHPSYAPFVYYSGDIGERGRNRLPAARQNDAGGRNRV